MDLSRWIAPPDSRKPSTPVWVDVRATAESVSSAAPRSWIEIERCLGPDDAAALVEQPDILGVYCLSMGEGVSVHGLEPWSPDSQPPEGRSEMMVAVRVHAEPSDQSDYVPDPLSREAVATWIESSLPTLVPSSEEASWALRCPAPVPAGRGAVVWTADFARLYAERWDGERVTDLLPLLWFDGPRAGDLRLRYRLLVADLFRAHFLEPVAAWCEGAGRKLVAHVDAADSFIGQITQGWGPTMCLQEAAHGAVVAEANPDTDSPLLLKQAVSVSHQFERDSILNETFDGRDGRTGALADFRVHAERAVVRGATQLAVRPAPIMPRGDGKRLAGPAAPSQAQPWHEDWQELGQGIARMSDLLGQGKRLVNVLVLAPDESLMASAQAPLPPNMSAIGGRAKPNLAARDLEKQLVHLLDALETFHIDFDLGDEELLARHGRVEANTFWLGPGGEYTIVVLPPAISWRADTMRKLRRFARKGGSVIAARPIAPLVDFSPSTAIEELAENYPNVSIVERSGREVSHQINRVDPRIFSIRPTRGDARALRVQHRRTDSRDVFFVANTSRTEEVEARVEVQADGAIRVLDPWTPQVLLKDADNERDAQVFLFNFHAATATLFAFGGEADLTEPPHQRRPHATTARPLGETWEFDRLDPNLLPLKRCHAQVDDQPLSPRQDGANRAMPVEFVRIALRDMDLPADGAMVSLSFEFDSEINGVGRRAEIIVESNSDQAILVNGQAPTEITGADSDAPPTPHWADFPGFQRFDISPLLAVGANKVLLRFHYDGSETAGNDPTVVESPIVAGDFAVALTARGRPSLTEEPTTLRNGSWTEQGYPFYSGWMRYRQSVELDIEPRKRYFLALPRSAGAALRACIGEHEGACLTYPPHRMEITRQARDGEMNTIEIDVASTLHNLWGPIHTAAKLAHAPNPSPTIYDEIPYRDRRLWNAAPQLVPFGLMGGATVETYDPDAPPPEAKKQANPVPDEDEVKEQEQESIEE